MPNKMLANCPFNNNQNGGTINNKPYPTTFNQLSFVFIVPNLLILYIKNGYKMNKKVAALSNKVVSMFFIIQLTILVITIYYN